jgi:hypothetical protein
MFRHAARRVLTRRGVPQDRVEAEIARLRQIEPAFNGPTFDEFLAASSAGDDKR